MICYITGAQFPFGLGHCTPQRNAQFMSKVPSILFTKHNSVCCQLKFPETIALAKHMYYRIFEKAKNKEN
jgi:hypothetical protein